MTELTKKFKPEFLNRLDEIVVFKPLEQKIIKSIVNNHIEEVKKTIGRKRNNDRVFQKSNKQTCTRRIQSQNMVHDH